MSSVPKTEISIFHYFQILNQKVKWQESMEYIEVRMASVHVTFICNRQRWNYTMELFSPIGVNPGAEGILKALESITISEPKNIEEQDGK
jgi:hypothetical protein